MSVAKNSSPLIEKGIIEGFTYELRGSDSPIVHVFREVDGKLYHKATQKGGMTAERVARMLISEMPKAAKGAA